MIYAECERNGTLVPSQTNPSNHHNLNILSSHLNNPDYLATAAMALSPKYNTAFSVTNLLNPVLEESYKKQQQQHQQQLQLQTQDASNSFSQALVQSYQNSRNATSNLLSASSTASSSSSSSSSSASSSTPSSSSNSNSSNSSSINVKHSPTHNIQHPSFGNYQASSFSSVPSSNSSISSSSSSSSSSNSSNCPPIANPYFNYQAATQFSSSIHPGSHLNPNQGLNNPNSSHLSHHYNLQQYTNSAYCNGIGGVGSSSSNDNENMGYVNSQIQSYSNPPASWYPSPNSDPRFASKI